MRRSAQGRSLTKKLRCCSLLLWSARLKSVLKSNPCATLRDMHLSSRRFIPLWTVLALVIGCQTAPNTTAIPSTTTDSSTASTFCVYAPAADPQAICTEADRRIGALPLEASLGGPAWWNNATSLWRNGSVWDRQHTNWDHLFVASQTMADQRVVITQGVVNGGAHAQSVSHIWISPEPINNLTITAITGPHGVLSFTTAKGRNGTLDLDSGNWRFQP